MLPGDGVKRPHGQALGRAPWADHQELQGPPQGTRCDSGGSGGGGGGVALVLAGGGVVGFDRMGVSGWGVGSWC